MAERRTARLALALLGLTAPLVLVAGTAAPSYASSSVCGTPLATLLGQDCTAPVARVYSAKADHGFQDLSKKPETTARDAEFYMSTQAVDPDGDKVTFECRLERDGTVVTGQDWADCTDPDPSDIYDYSRGHVAYTDLTPGSYKLLARAEDAAVDKSSLILNTPAHNVQDPPTTFTWTVTLPVDDTTPPNTRFTRAPARWHLSQFGDWGYAGTEPLQGARCTLQGRVLSRSCDSASAFATLTAGDWTFTVAGIDFAGNRDASPAVNRFTVPVPSNKLGASKGWTRGTEIGYFFSGYSTTRKKGASLSAARAGTRAVALVATKCPGCGSVKVMYAGKVLKTVSLAASSTRKRQLIPIASWSGAHGGKVSVVTTSAKPVTIEGLGFSKRP